MRGIACGSLTRARRGYPRCRADTIPGTRGAFGFAKFLEGVDPIYAGAIRRRAIGVRHVPTAAELRILAASSTSLLGYGAHAGVIVFDEVGAAGSKGRAVFDALLTGLGKRHGQRLLALGTRSPSGRGIGGPGG